MNINDNDRERLDSCAFLPALATGMAGVLVGLYVAHPGLSATCLG